MGSLTNRTTKKHHLAGNCPATIPIFASRQKLWSSRTHWETSLTEYFDAAPLWPRLWPLGGGVPLGEDHPSAFGSDGRKRGSLTLVSGAAADLAWRDLPVSNASEVEH